ncbi:MAG: acyl-ACP--UDP-N-acetylglucosamine O-acyltransferase [Synechococcaceae cyanobacterium RL_1_2]|nr:acyl-ACP--UDP-N-acetylglucosamine O-acyltransferase [Synechococcaceae cyanobacterium RL_1_2]
MIHPTAIIHPSAQLAADVSIGPYAVIGEDVSIGAGTTVASHAIIHGPTEIGQENKIFPGAAIGLDPQDLKYKGDRSYVRIGDRNTLREYVTVNRATHEGEETRIGNDNLLMAYVHVAHNCIIENQVIISNSVALAGHVKIESRAVIGGIVGVHQFVHIGKMAMIAGMTRIVRDVPPFMLVEGSPAKVRTLNMTGLKRANISSEELKLMKQAFRHLYRSELPPTKAAATLLDLGSNPYLEHLHHFLCASMDSDRRGLIPGNF